MVTAARSSYIIRAIAYLFRMRVSHTHYATIRLEKRAGQPAASAHAASKPGLGCLTLFPPKAAECDLYLDALHLSFHIKLGKHHRMPVVLTLVTTCPILGFDCGASAELASQTAAC